MEKVKVISEKYNDEDVLHMDGQDLADAYLDLVKEGKIPEGLKILKRKGLDLTAPDTELLLTGKYAVLINGILFIPGQVDTSDESLLMYKFNIDEVNHILTCRTCWFYPSEDVETQTYGMTLVNDLYWASFEVKSVEANPTLAGTESALEGLQVGNTKYKVNRLEDIKDSAGNSRFIEGEVSQGASAVVSQLTKSYGKWSLSGSHLIVVLMLENLTENDLTISQYTALGQANLPQWIADKIYPITNSSVVSLKSFNIGNPSSILTIKANKKVYLEKDSGHFLNLSTAESLPLEANDFIRIEYDLLIDSDYSD